MITPHDLDLALAGVNVLWKTRRDQFPNWHGFAVTGKGETTQIEYYIRPDTDGGELLAASSKITEFVPVVIKNLPQFVQACAKDTISGDMSLRPGTGVRSTSPNRDCKKRCPGTIGAFLRQKGTTSPVWLLSNHHVLVRDPDCLPVQVFSQQNELISTTVKFIPLDDLGNLVDVAVAKIDPALPDALYDPMKVSTPDPIMPANGDPVQKLGAITGLTCGIAHANPNSFDVLDCTEENNFEFVNQIVVYSISGAPPFLQKGDSGSLVVSKGQPVGLLFALSNPASASMPTGLVNPWQAVINKLETTIDPDTKQPIIPAPVELILKPNIKTVDPCR